MREFESPIERDFAAALFAELAARPIPIAVIPQYVVGHYRADFALRVGTKITAVECDGHDFHNRTPEQAQHDRERDRFFAERGITVLRFTGSELCRRAQACARQALHIAAAAGTPEALLEEDRLRLIRGVERSIERKRLADSKKPPAAPPLELLEVPAAEKVNP